MNRIPQVTKHILLINLFMMIFTMLRENFMMSTFALYYPTSPLFHWWQPLTHMFMHGGWWHFFFNMFTMLMFGCTLERQWGPKKFLTFYIVTGLGAAMLHLGVTWLQIHSLMGEIADGGATAAAAMSQINFIKRVPMVGASGAIYGLLLGFAMLYPNDRITCFLLFFIIMLVSILFPGSAIVSSISDILFVVLLVSMFLPGGSLMRLFIPVSLKAKWWVIIMAAMELCIGVFALGDGIAHFAHLGGMLFGFLMIKRWKRKGEMYQYEGWN